MHQLAGRNVIITGASSGIGAALAREAAERGARVGLVARRRERLEELAEEIARAGGTAVFAAADVRDEQGLAAALDGLERELGGVDVAVANAGFGRSEPPSRFKPGRAQVVYDVNLAGMLRLIDWALPRFLAQERGHLVGIASAAGFLGAPGNAAYSGSKAAMRVHLQSLRLSLRPYGIAVTTISPGFVRSELTDHNQHWMPFLWPTDRAARRIADAIERRAGEVVFPWQVHLLLALIRRLPTRLVERLAAERRRR